MRLPKPGVKPEELKCKKCGMKAADQPNDISLCSHEDCPNKKAIAEAADESTEK